jgi:hypothetical protein
MAIGFQVTFDAHDPDRLARFWAEALDYVVQPPPDGFDSWPAFLTSIGVAEDRWDSASAVVDPAGVGPRLFFQKVPEGKTAKNRVHLDVNVGGPRGTPDDERAARVEAHVARLVAAGATVVQVMEDLGERWVVLTDPEGNELCVQ